MPFRFFRKRERDIFDQYEDRQKSFSNTSGKVVVKKEALARTTDLLKKTAGSSKGLKLKEKGDLKL